MPNKVPGYPGAVGYWGRSSYKRVQDEQTAGKVRALLQDKLLTRGQPAHLYLPVTTGTVCTCRKDTNQVNDRPCPQCYGTGFVPGYARFLHETLFFTASQVSSLTITGQTLSPPVVTSTGVFAPSVVGVAQGVSAPAWSLSTSVGAPGIASAGSLFASPINSTSVFAPSVTTNMVMFNNITLERQFKPNYVMLAEGATTGFLQTAAIPYDNPDGAVWEAHSDGYLRVAGNTITVEYSFDGGAAFFPLADIASANPPPTGAGTLIFRVTLTRASATDRSPFWGAVRARHANAHLYNAAQITDLRGNVSPGEILVLRPWVVEQAQSDTGRGTLVEWMADRSWTMPLDFFDLSVTADTPAARIPDRAPGPHPFYVFTRGIKQGDRVVLTALKWNEEFGTFTHQSFDERRAQDMEPPYADVF